MQKENNSFKKNSLGNIFIDLYFFSSMLTLMSLFFPFIEVEFVPITFSAWISTLFSVGVESPDVLLVAVAFFYVLCLLFAIRGLVICIKTWICKASGNKYTIGIGERFISIFIYVLSFVLMIAYIFENKTYIEFGFIIFLVTMAYSSVFQFITD